MVRENQEDLCDSLGYSCHIRMSLLDFCQARGDTTLELILSHKITEI